MMNFFSKGLFAGLAIGAASLSAQAQIVQFDFTDTQNSSKTVVASSSTNYLNPKAGLSILTLAGLDRKVQLTVKNSANTVVFDQTSANITVTSRYTSSTGASFYGSQFTLPALPEGNYTFISTVKDLSGTVVSTSTYSALIDFTAPTISGDFIYTVGGLTYGSIDIFGVYSPNIISIGGIADALSGIASAKYYAIDPSSVKRSITAAITNATPASISLDSATASSATLCPTDRAEYEIGVDIIDKAGNVGTKSRLSQIDRTQPPYSVEVYNSSLASWEPYKTATSYENPIKYRWKIAKTDLTTFNGTKYGYPLTPQYTDATYGYKEATIAIPAGSSNYWVMQTLAGTNTTFNFTSLNGTTLAGSAQLGPQWVSSAFAKVGEDLVAGSSINVSTPTTFDRYQVNVQSRTYDQIATLNGKTCTIPAGLTSCILNPVISYSSGRGYNPYQLNIRNTSGTLGQSPTYFYTYWDFNPPVIDSFTWDASTKKASVRVIDNDRINNWQIGMWNTTNITVAAVNTSATSTNLTQVQSWDEDYKTKNRVFSVSNLPDGAYTLVATAKDTYGNTTTQSITGPALDNTPPSVTISGVSAGNLQKLSSLLIDVTDNMDANPIISSISLTGGPVSDNLTLGFNLQSGIYHVESPRMFPSTDATQTYTLTVIAKDNQGNITTKAISFMLQPENLVSLGTINTIATLKPLQDANNIPLSTAFITAAKTSTGEIATGKQIAYFTLRKDAAYPVIVEGVTVNAGETKEFSITLDSNGKATLPIYQTQDGLTGSASFMIDIPQLVLN